MCPCQKQCGSCVAFSNMALVETCFKKVTGVFGDYAEQQFVDCGYMFHVLVMYILICTLLTVA